MDNDILLRKLANVGFTPKHLNFMADYLRNRRQYVQVTGCRSENYYIRSGVSQGSTLGPIQFLIMVDDLPGTVMSAQCLLFDDVKIFMGVKNRVEADALQKDIAAVAEWSTNNNLPLNVSK